MRTLTGVGDGLSWLAGWSYRKSITIDHTKVVGNLTNFPVLVSVTDSDLAHVDSGGHVAMSDGSDIVFTDGGITQLSHELEKYEHSTGELVAWVNVPAVSSILDTVLYIYYGRAYCAPQELQENVWDSSFSTVYHLNELSTTSQTEKNTATFDFTPVMMRIGPDSFVIFYRTSAAELGDGKIVKRSYDPILNAFGVEVDVHDDLSYDSRNPGGGQIDNDIYLFLARRDSVAGIFVDMGYIKSMDAGATWGVYTTIAHDVALTVYSPYGHMVHVGNTYYQPYYGNNGAGTYKLKLFQSIDGGATWTDGPTIYSGAVDHYECCVEYIGANKLIGLARIATGVMAQFESSDGGVTWTAPSATNLGNGITMGWLVCEGQRITVYYNQRGNTRLMFADGFVSTVFGHSTAWVGATTIDASTGTGGGYPSIVRWKPNHFLIAYYKYVGIADCDLRVLHHTIRMLNSRQSGTLGTESPLYGGPTGVASAIDGGREFSGASYIKVEITTALLNFIQNTGIFTIEAWMKLDNYAAVARQTICGSTGTSAEKGCFLAYENSAGNRQMQMYVVKGVGGTPVIDSRSANNTIGDNNFHHIVAIGDGTNVTWYVDGVPQLGSNAMVAKSVGDSTRSMDIGVCNGAALADYLDGKIDEVRISTIARTDQWIRTCYNNQSSPLTFCVVGAETP